MRLLADITILILLKFHRCVAKKLASWLYLRHLVSIFIPSDSFDSFLPSMKLIQIVLVIEQCSRPHPPMVHRAIVLDHIFLFLFQGFSIFFLQFWSPVFFREQADKGHGECFCVFFCKAARVCGSSGFEFGIGGAGEDSELHSAHTSANLKCSGALMRLWCAARFEIDPPSHPSTTHRHPIPRPQDVYPSLLLPLLPISSCQR